MPYRELPIRPQLCKAAVAPILDDAWTAEVKFDGFRAIVIIEAGRSVRVLSRHGNDLTEPFPELAPLAEHFPIGSVVDGELCVLRPDGHADFNALGRRARSRRARERATFVAFDLPREGSSSLVTLPLEQRRARLQERLPQTMPYAFFSKSVDGTRAGELFAMCERLGIEGIVCKPRAQRYEEGRRSWIKVKTTEGLRVTERRGRAWNAR